MRHVRLTADLRPWQPFANAGIRRLWRRVRALVRELVEGPTLAERLTAGPIPLDESLSIARQIAVALEQAHDKGIIHRDLKPQNVKAPMDGTIKVLDFDLAKAMASVTDWVRTLERVAPRSGR